MSGQKTAPALLTQLPPCPEQFAFLLHEVPLSARADDGNAMPRIPLALLENARRHEAPRAFGAPLQPAQNMRWG